ncbi:hypothetical protein [Bradyrhizobium sp. SZCCHNS1054]|uniref:hypothetical protein n=1 Tax=Bradyrhizobium sp. SZCCHNS1054 TaxID=3057301 RepID=UPI0029162EFD|nr:hypothetical protein [Bradyrhizobium sp. SZCCHNS1054]
MIEELSIAKGAATGKIASRIEIPSHADPSAPSGKSSYLVANGKLKTWSQIQADIKKLRDEAKEDSYAAAVLIEAERDKLLDELGQLSIDLTAGGSAFFGVSGLALAAVTVGANLRIDPVAFDKGSRDVPFLTARLVGTGQANVMGNQTDAEFSFEVTVTADEVVNMLPSISIHPQLKVPALDLHWPKIPWPDFGWVTLDLSGLAKLLRFDLPIPNSPVSINWDAPQQPKFTLSVDSNSKQLSLQTQQNQKYSGSLIYQDGSATPPSLARITDFTFALSSGGNVALTGKIAPQPLSPSIPALHINQPDLLPFDIQFSISKLTIAVPTIDLSQPLGGAITATLDVPRITISAKSDPSLMIAVHAAYMQTYDTTTGKSSGRLDTLEIIEPYPIKLVTFAAEELAAVAEAVVRFVSGIRIPDPGFPDTAGLGKLLERIADMVAAAVRWLLQHGGGGGSNPLLGIAQAVGEVIARLVRMLVDAIKAVSVNPGVAPWHLLIEIRLDSRTYALRQIVIMPAWGSAPSGSLKGGDDLGLGIEIPLDWQPLLVVDLDGSPSVALLAIPPKNGSLATLGTDLWLSQDSGIQAVRDTDTNGQRVKDQRLIQAQFKFKQDNLAVAFVRVAGGKVQFFRLCDAKLAAKPLTLPAWTQLPPNLTVATISGGITYTKALDWNDVDMAVSAQAQRLLPFLQSSDKTGSSFLDTLGQYIQVKAPGKPVLQGDGIAQVPISVELKIKDTSVDFDLQIVVDVKDLSVNLKTKDPIVILGDASTSAFDLLGLQGNIVLKDTDGGKWPRPGDSKYPFFNLDFSKGDARLALARESRLDLCYGQVASGGRGIVFLVDSLAISRGGLDLDAKVDHDTPVQLAGVDMPFRFDSGGLSIKNGQIQAFSIKGAGQLPPELVGEANATISISMGRGSDGSLIVQSAEANLDKANDPIVCHATRFVLTISALGFEFQNFASEGSGYHFYFTLTGTAEFRPREGEFTDGLLKYLGTITINLDKAPLARDPSMLLRAISFQVAVVPAKRFNFFNLFNFELRGIGFHPASPAFGGKPALSISGQVNFVESGDIVSPKFDFHELWIAPPKQGQSLPQIRFDGLTLGIRFGGAASIEGMAIAVDDSLPSLYAPGALPKDVTVHGFLAQGKMTIKGWGAMSAAMGFLELQKPGGELRRAFFLYGEADELSIEIPTPVGPIYLREVGFGFGYRFTIAAFNRADQVKSVAELIKVLDDVSKFQGNLASVKAWEPEAEGNRVTLALRGLITIESASEETDYDADGEKDLPNPILFDIVVALRSDFTFFLNARVWIARNYADWHDSSVNDPWRNNPTLRGYVYLSVPRKEFLGRLIADGTGDVEGKHPELPAPLVKAMKNIRWSATTYIRPGLFHQEFGWPYELGFTFEEKLGGGSFQIVCSGGLINRIEDGAMLYGIAFRAKGYAQFGGQVGGRSFGASAVARADFSIDAKFIAYISVKRFSDTLFYGSISFDVSISLQVRIWLEFSVGFTDIHLEVGFSVSLTISIALEAAAEPAALAARGSASVAVGAFGRHVRLGISFAINPGRLDEARARVERFMQLGLTASMPDAEQGIAPPAPELPRGPRAGDADQAANNALDKHDDVAGNDSAVPVPSGQPQPPPNGRPLQPTAYWAILYPVVGDDKKSDDERRYVMIFVPRDHTETGLHEADLPIYGPGGQSFSSFYPPSLALDGPPNTPSDALSLATRTKNGAPRIPAPVPVLRLDATTGKQPAVFDPTTPIDVSYDIDWTVAVNGSEKMKLGAFLSQCFIRKATVQGPADLAEPLDTQILADPQRLPDSREVAAQILTDAGRDQIALGIDRRAANDIEERRSAAIAALCDSAAKLAAGGEALWTSPAKDGLDIRTLGLTFVVKGSDLQALFEGGDGTKPRPAKFNIVSKVASISAFDGNVHLFNPPERMFRTYGPRLAEPIIEATPGGIRLDWDLEPPFGDRTGVWNDPEFNLKHYRIERIVTSADNLDSPFRPLRTTVKAAAPLSLIRDPVGGNFVWRFIRPNAQFVDDLSDLPEPWRRNILPPSNVKDVSPPAPLVQGMPGSVVLRYTIVPVDTAGTDGPPTPLVLNVVKPDNEARKAVSRASLNFEYRSKNASDAIKGVTAAWSPTTITLGIDDGIDPTPTDPAKRPPLATTRTYNLRVRPEQSVPIGLYGADAVDDAKARPSAGDFKLRRTTDQDFVITLTSGAGILQPSFDDPQPVGTTSGSSYTIDSMPRFLRAIGAGDANTTRQDKGPIGVRFAIQPAAGSGEADAPWCPMDITLLIDFSNKDGLPDKSPAVAVPVEVFEHPVQIDVAPLLSEDLDGDAGRIVVLHPEATATLDELLAQPGPEDPDKRPLTRLRDLTRRVGTRVQWNARPVAEEVPPLVTAPLVAGGPTNDRSAKRNAAFFGGYDIFEVDAAGEAEGATSAPTATALRCPFDKSVADGNPGNALRYDNAKGAIYVGGDQVAELDSVNEAGAMTGAQLRLISASDASKAMSFDLKVYVRARGYRKLMVTPFPQALVPFANGEQVVLLLTNDPPAKHVARVQALPTSLARLDPAEIADFAKVEAHYPSETLRLRASAADRQSSWYSPAESFLVWPTRTLSRSLSINVDEPILTEMLSNGRPERISMQLAIVDKVKGTTLKGSVQYPFDGGFVTVLDRGMAEPNGGKWTAGTLRDFLQALVWDTYDSKIRAAFADNPDPFHNATVTLRALKSANGQDVELARADWGIDLDPPLHPVLADVIDFARYASGPSRILPYPHLAFDNDTQKALTDWLNGQTAAFGQTVSFSIDQWTGSVAKPLIGFQVDKESKFQSEDGPATYRIDGTLKPDKKAQAIGDAVARLALKLSGDQLKQLQGASFTAALKIDLGQAQKSFAFNSVINANQGPKYRRYEPVLEQLPKVNAKDVAGWFDETPPQRDPYGWSILRTLGLAAGLKLYDTEARDYLPPRDTLNQLRTAFKEIIGRYPHDDVGAPFVDIITHAGGTMSLASFDGGMSGVSKSDVDALLDDQALSLVQISLRPTVDRFANRWTNEIENGWQQLPIDKAVAYFALQADAGEAAIDVTKLPVDLVIIAEVIDLTLGLAKPPIIPLISNKYDPKDENIQGLIKAFLDGANGGFTFSAKGSGNVAIVRVTVSGGNAAAVFGPAIVKGTLKEIKQPLLSIDQPFAVFGRFPDMFANRFGALAGAHPAVHDTVLSLKGYIEKRLPDGWPSSSDEPTLLQRLADWTRRFFDHGPTSAPNLTAAPPFAVAEVTRPDPWRVGVNSDGTMQVLFTHDDRKRRLKRYAIRPFGRYDSFVDALSHAGNPSAEPTPPRLGGAWSDVFAKSSDPQRTFEDNWCRRYFDVVLPRTEPVAPPVLIDAKRIEISNSSTKESRKVLEFLFARHPEEILSEANVTVEGALSFETVSFGFWREFPMQTWANDIAPGISTTEHFGDWTNPPVPKLIESDDHFGGLASLDEDGQKPGRFTDGWRGALALRTEALPFFFRTHVAAFASAGVVVSDPVVATIEEGHYQLTLPWSKGSAGDVLVPTPAPDWSVSRVDSGPLPHGIWVTFDLPAARLFDSMLQDSRKIWLQGRPIPDVFMLPDPQVRYEIAVVAADDAGLSSASVELDIVATQRAAVPPPPPAPPTPKPSSYRTNLVGPLFESTAPAPNPTLTASGTTWMLSEWAKLPETVTPNTVFEPLIKPAEQPVASVTDALRLFEIKPTDFVAWAPSAPATTMQLTVAPPTNPLSWTAFIADVTSWRDRFMLYATMSPAAQDAADYFASWIIGPTAPRPNPTHATTAFIAGLPRLNSPTQFVTLIQTTGWTWPSPKDADIGVTRREAVRAIKTVAHATNYSDSEFVAGVGTPVISELRRIKVVRTEKANRFMNYPEFNAVLPAGAIAEDALALMASSGLPACIDVTIAVPITVDLTAQGIRDRIVDFVNAVEAADYTALAIQELGALEDQAVLPLLVQLLHLPSRAVAGDVLAKLNALDSDAIGRQTPWALRLRLAPNDDERAKIMTAIDGLTVMADRKAALKSFIHGAMTDQIFGAGRSPRLKAYRGISTPQQDSIARKGYPWPIQ